MVNVPANEETKAKIYTERATSENTLDKVGDDGAVVEEGIEDYQVKTTSIPKGEDKVEDKHKTTKTTSTGPKTGTRRPDGEDKLVEIDDVKRGEVEANGKVQIQTEKPQHTVHDPRNRASHLLGARRLVHDVKHSGVNSSPIQIVNCEETNHGGHDELARCRGWNGGNEECPAVEAIVITGGEILEVKEWEREGRPGRFHVGNGLYPRLSKSDPDLQESESGDFVAIMLSL
ncbi:hypothetical protein BDZ89DRAFT_1035563 [Hymenopellis radicata]|nr:hypothetical protein BDZ89DRAFT_1035563 [Hymenopellis radicata]